MAEKLGSGPHTDFNVLFTNIEADAREHGVKLTAKRKKLLQTMLASIDENAEPVIKKIHKQGSAEADPLHGLYEVEIDGKLHIVEYESAGKDLKDNEQVPLLEDGGIEAFFRREVLPHVPDAWIDDTKTKIGYEISFTRYFYKPEKLRTREEITADIRAMEAESEGLLEKIIGVPSDED